MHIMVMLSVLALVFFVALFLMCFFRKKLNNPIVNPLFLIVCAVCFFCWNYAAYERGWLKDGFMTLENISPFICTIILLTPFMSEKIKDFANCSIAFLGFGMFLALFISPGSDYFMHHVQVSTFAHVSEAVCHLSMALYGFYLILVDKVKLTWEAFGKSLVFIYTAIGFGVFLNWCFHLGNFGMDMYGDYSIYFIDIFGSFEITFIAYLVGVFATIAMGYLVGMFLNWLSKPQEEEEPQPIRISPEEMDTWLAAQSFEETEQ
ncbi:MAG: hypothetical protein IJB94_05145 [Clostridia bacterium]|nr:hypothetical protein [Clostridia bacterium]MBQ4274338.1 hypothetical protein [Clostridia bacterium]